MKRHLFLTWSVFLLLSYSCLSQEYSYTHYDVKDGLASSNVYCITQDIKGFIWIGTDAGVCRFDGSHFKNFTLEDGLPDIEVLQIFADSKGRIWMAPFRKSICYYFNGRIHNEANDSLLKGVHIRGNIEGFAEDKHGNILAQEQTGLHLFTPGGGLVEYWKINGRDIDTCIGVCTSPKGNFYVQARGVIYELKEGKFEHYLSFKLGYDKSLYISLSASTLAWRQDVFKYRIMSLRTGKIIELPYEGWATRHISFSIVSDSLAYRNEVLGTVEYNIYTGAVRTFYLGTQISRTFRDDEGNTWFTSLGQGLFRLNSNTIRNISLFSARSSRCAVFNIEKAGNELLIGTNNSMVFRYALPSFRDAGSYKFDPSETEDIRFVYKMPNGQMLVGSSSQVDKAFPGKKFTKQGRYGVKFGVKIDDARMLVGSHHGVFVMDIASLVIKDTLWRERATTAFYYHDTTYVGTINGLYIVKRDKSVEYWGHKDSVLSKRISSIVRAPDGTMWVATYGGGIVSLKEGKPMGILTRKQGLSSDLCRVINLHDNTLWVGTDKGLNSVDLASPDFPVTTYTANDGLGSDIVNALYTDNSMIYVGTPVGLSFFDVSRVEKSAGCRLMLVGLINSGKDLLDDSARLRLSYKESNIRFEFAAISYKSSGNISYHYRMLGLDSAWKKTKESFLEYPTLPSGDYELQLQAVNKSGVQSRILSLHFTVTTPFWKTLWFDGAVLLLFLMLTWLFVTLRIKYLRRRQAEHEALHKRLAETEHIALQAQMNPHFIFNCLNSIQQYIFDQDIFAANKYITGFAKLIRATLQHSSKNFISLKDEIDYLSSYLSLEKLRFKEKMSYSIDVAPSLISDLEEIHIPPMLIQPYVENSMRHGLRHRIESGGYILINILQEGDKLVFIIEDNGIGRQEAARYKTREHIEYQSKGMSLTADRIRLINSLNSGSIRVEVIDMQDPQGAAAGTRVIVKFPRYDLIPQKNTI